MDRRNRRPLPAGPTAPAVPRRVLFVESYPQVVYGQQRTIFSLLDACDRTALAPVVAVPAEGPFVDEVRARAIPVEVLPYPSLLARYGGAFFHYSPRTKALTAWQVARYARRIRERLRALRIDGVFCNDNRGLLTVGLAARTLGVPVMIWDKTDRPHGWLDALQLPLSTVNVVIADAVTARYPGWQVRLFNKRIVKIFNGVDLKTFEEARGIRNELGLAEDDVALALVGTITERKGHDRILRIFDRLAERLPCVKLLVVGEPATDEDRRYFERLPNRDHPRVAWLGLRVDVPRVMKSIDVLVAPSRHEGIPRVCVEAMGAGKPVVGARAGGIPEAVVDGETGLLFDGDDPDGLLECLVRLGSSRELREEMGGVGRARAERHFDRAKQMPKVLDLLLESMSRRGERPLPMPLPLRGAGNGPP